MSRRLLTIETFISSIVSYYVQSINLSVYRKQFNHLLFLHFKIVVLLAYFVQSYVEFIHILNRKRKRVALLVSCYSKSSAALPRGAMGWSALYDCGISDYTYFLFYG